jgi:hypothetical protein
MMNKQATTDEKKVYIDVSIQAWKNQLNNFFHRATTRQLPQWEGKHQQAQRAIQKFDIARLREETLKNKNAYIRSAQDFDAKPGDSDKLYQDWQACQKRLSDIEGPVSEASEKVAALLTGIARCRELLTKVDRIGKAALEAQAAYKQWDGTPFKSDFGAERRLYTSRIEAETKWIQLEATIEKLFDLL